MDYDVWGPWSPTVGPNSPLKDSCAPSPQGSAISAVNSWYAAGFPVSQVILGVAAYGHSYFVRREDAYDGETGKIKPYVPFDRCQQPHGDKWDSIVGEVDACGSSTVVGGVFNFWGLVEAGFLTDKGNPAEGIDYTFDHCSKTVRDSRTHISDRFTDYFLNPAFHI